MILLLIAIFPLYAQIPEGVYIQKITGNGSNLDDNDVLYALLANEIKAWGFVSKPAPDYADYIFQGNLIPPFAYSEGESAYPESRCLFQYNLRDNAGKVLYENSVYYLSLDEVKEYITGSLASFFSSQTFCFDDAYYSLYSQIAGSSLYIPKVTGTGSAPKDNADITAFLAKEMAAWGFSLVKTPGEADYFLTGTLSPPDADFEGGAVCKNTFHYFLQDKDGTILYELAISYADMEEIQNYLVGSFSSLFSTQAVSVRDEPVRQPEIVKQVEVVMQTEAGKEPGSDAWRNQNWYFGAGVFWNPRMYTGLTQEAHLFNFGFNLQAEFHFQNYVSGRLKFLKCAAVGTGVEFSGDWVIVWPETGNHYRNTILQIPLVLNYVFRHGDRFIHEIYAGLQLNIPFFNETIPPLLSWKAGFQYGVKTGSGIFYADTRFSMDFGKSGINARHPADDSQYYRYMMYIGIGYKYNFLELITK
ncbi:MAG: hypothetical protein LBH43_11615 [Treponema sp.]|nr:hypothetical protein [Treponema sp.]